MELISQIFVAVLTAWITVQLSMGKFRQEKWWEKKAEAYSVLLGAIHDAKAFAEENLNAEYHERELTAEEDSSLRAKSQKAEGEIYRAMDVGAFYLSSEAIDRLGEYKRQYSEIGKDNSWVGYLADDLEITDRCLKDMIKIAKKDLAVQKHNNAVLVAAKRGLDGLRSRFSRPKP